MNLAQPHALWCLLLAVPVVLLYRRRRAPSRVEVSTAFLWPEVWTAFARQMAAQRWRGAAGLALNLTVLLLFTLALADPRARQPLREVLLFAGPQPAAVKQSVLSLVEKVGPRDRLAILSAGDRARVHCPLTCDRQELAQAAEEAAQTKPATPAALALAQAAAATMSAADTVAISAASGSEWKAIPPDKPWWLYPASAAVLLLILEWPLYQRRWID